MKDILEEYGCWWRKWGASPWDYSNRAWQVWYQPEPPKHVLLAQNKSLKLAKAEAREKLSKL